MFGYVRPRRDLLAKDAFAAYHAAYCGLCHALGKHYGFRARFLVNYDMTFLALLRASARESCPVKHCWCPARVFGRKACSIDGQNDAVTAACTVILCYEKLRDNVRDESVLRALPYRLLCWLFRRAYRKASRRLPDFAALCVRQLSALHELEQQASPSIDATADAFARIVSACVGDLQDPALRRPMEQILYHTGRFLYLADALDDLQEDCRRTARSDTEAGCRRPSGALSAADLDYLTQLTDSSVNLAGAALELLPLASNRQLLENMIFLGFPAVFSAVKSGKFQARELFWKKEIRKRTIQE